jgi:hypothetical protein
MNIRTLDQVADALVSFGYEAETVEGGVICKVGASKDPFMCLINNVDQQLNIVCKVATLGDFEEGDVPLITYNALNANSRIRPFAFEIIDGRDDPTLIEPKDFMLVLADSMPIGDLSDDELEKSMQSLRTALHTLGQVIRVTY